MISSKLTGTELIALVHIVDDVLVFAARKPGGRYKVGDPVPVVDHGGRPYYYIRGRRYRPDALLAAVKAADPAVFDTYATRRVIRLARHQADKARDVEITAMLQAGTTYADVGEKFGISRQRVKQIADSLARTGVDANPRTARLNAKKSAMDAANATLYGSHYQELVANPTLLRYLKYRIRVKRNHARAQKLVFDLTISDMLPLPTHCPVLGIQLSYANTRGNSDTSLSFDRIDPTKGYTKDNVVFVSQRANRIKDNATPQELIKVADFYSRYLTLDAPQTP